MANNKLVILTLLMGLSYLSSCYYDVEQELYPPNPCDVTSVSFSNQITTTLQTYCMNCHSNAASSNSGGGISLEGYNSVKVYVDNGKFLSSITHNGTSSAMPKGGSKIPTCNISFVQAWINGGALNN